MKLAILLISLIKVIHSHAANSDASHAHAIFVESTATIQQVQTSSTNKLFFRYQNTDRTILIREKLNDLTEFLEAGQQYDTWIVAYAGKRACAAEAKRRGVAAMRYLIQHGVERKRIHVIEGGHHENWAVELWVTIRGTTGPPPTPTVSRENVRIIKKKSYCRKVGL